MSRSFNVAIETTAYAVVKVTLSDKQLARVADDICTPVEELTVENLVDAVETYIDYPTICAKCSGWRRNYSLEFSDQWEFTGASAVSPFHSAIEEITE